MRVKRIVEELVESQGCLAVWLVGSRANGTARRDSDWDLLISESEDPRGGRAAVRGVDILRVGPSRFLLADGYSPDPFTQDFREWQWTVVSEDEASYLGLDRVCREAPSEVDSDGLDEPYSPRYTQLRARLLGSRHRACPQLAV